MACARATISLLRPMMVRLEHCLIAGGVISALIAAVRVYLTVWPGLCGLLCAGVDSARGTRRLNAAPCRHDVHHRRSGAADRGQCILPILRRQADESRVSGARRPDRRRRGVHPALAAAVDRSLNGAGAEAILRIVAFLIISVVAGLVCLIWSARARAI